MSHTFPTPKLAHRYSNLNIDAIIVVEYPCTLLGYEADTNPRMGHAVCINSGCDGRLRFLTISTAMGSIPDFLLTPSSTTSPHSSKHHTLPAARFMLTHNEACQIHKRGR